MGSNGQQLIVELPGGSSKVRISGTNQNNQQVQWDGVASTLATPPSVAGLLGVFTNGWWWKGKVDIWYNDSAGNTQYFSTNVPVSYPSDFYIAGVPGVPGGGPLAGHTVKPPHPVRQ
jgi:hypothetical protein